MIAVIFEVFLAKGRVEEYLDIATELKSLLEKIDGSLFKSKSDEIVNWLSHSKSLIM
jgi:heme-degrading monooxygenase HmoA